MGVQQKSVSDIYGLLTKREAKWLDIGLKVYNDITKDWGQYPANFSQ